MRKLRCQLVRSFLERNTDLTGNDCTAQWANAKVEACNQCTNNQGKEKLWIARVDSQWKYITFDSIYKRELKQ
jgi:hypothetical protein